MIKRYDVIAFSTGILLVFFLLGFAQAQQPPKSVTVGTNPAGTVFYAVAGGLASVISGAAPFQAVVQPYTGTSTFLPLRSGRSATTSGRGARSARPGHIS